MPLQLWIIKIDCSLVKLDQILFFKLRIISISQTSKSRQGLVLVEKRVFQFIDGLFQEIIDFFHEFIPDVT